MAYNVISCRKVAENNQILKIAKFASLSSLSEMSSLVVITFHVYLIRVCQVQELPSQWNLGTPSHPPLLNMSWAWHPVFSSPRCSASAVWVWIFSSFFMLVFVFSSFHIYPIFYIQISFPKFFEIETIDTLRMEPLHSSSIVVLIFSNSFPTDISFSTMMDGLPHREMIF